MDSTLMFFSRSFDFSILDFRNIQDLERNALQRASERISSVSLAPTDDDEPSRRCFCCYEEWPIILHTIAYCRESAEGAERPGPPCGKLCASRIERAPGNLFWLFQPFFAAPAGLCGLLLWPVYF